MILQTAGAGRSVNYSISPYFDLLRDVDVEEYFSVQQDERKIKEHFNFDIFSLIDNEIFSKSEKHHLSLLQKEYQDNFSQIDSDTIIKKEFERILIEFSWKSSHIEGNTYSLLDTEALIKDNKVADDKTKEETQMILNHKNAFEFVLKNKNEFQTISRANIENIHQLLTSNLNITKNLRSAPVGITGTNYKPLDNAFQISEAIEKFIVVVNKKDNILEKAFLSLIMLSYIQAFEDGNKRTARMVANAILIAGDITPISYRAVNEIEYKKASLLFYEKNNISYFKQIFIEQFAFAVKNYFQK